MRQHRPDLLRGHSSAGADTEGGRLLEPPELWPDEAWQPSLTSQRLGVVLGEVYRRRRRKPEAQVRDLLEQQLQQAGLTWRPEFKDDFVRSMANEPPFLVGLLLRLIPRGRRQLEIENRHMDLEPPEDPEVDALLEKLLELPGVMHVGWNPEDDRAIHITLAPWSEETAERVRQLVAPRVVRFNR